MEHILIALNNKIQTEWLYMRVSDAVESFYFDFFSMSFRQLVFWWFLVDIWSQFTQVSYRRTTGEVHHMKLSTCSTNNKQTKMSNIVYSILSFQTHKPFCCLNFCYLFFKKKIKATWFDIFISNAVALTCFLSVLFGEL